MKTIFLILAAGKFGKFLISGGSMLLSIAAYAWVYGWTYAIGFVGLLLIHELGHYIAAKQRGLNVGLPTFIPFMGAWIDLKDQPIDAETEAYVGLAGPMLGSAAAFAIYLMSFESDGKMLLALAYAGFILNLFNLIPLTPLDGGRIVSVISPKIWFIGFPILVALFFWKHSPMLIFIGILALPQIWHAYQTRNDTTLSYYQASIATKLKYGIQYLVLTISLCVLSFELHEQLSTIARPF